MPLIQWDASFSVNVAEIDRQHHNLVRLINQLYDEMVKGKGRAILGKIIDELISYTASHFKTEEKYFDRFKYPDSLKHKKEHTDFVQTVTKFKTGFDEGNTMLSVKVMNFLQTWLRNHIKSTDKKYGPFFNQNGLK
jgi:hemerythrin